MRLSLGLVSGVLFLVALFAKAAYADPVCPQHRSALIYALLEFECDCQAGNARARDALIFNGFRNQDVYLTEQQSVQYPPAYSLLWLRTATLQQSVVMASTHGSEVSGSIATEFYPSNRKTEMLNAFVAYTNGGGYSLDEVSWGYADSTKAWLIWFREDGIASRLAHLADDAFVDAEYCYSGLTAYAWGAGSYTYYNGEVDCEVACASQTLLWKRFNCIGYPFVDKTLGSATTGFGQNHPSTAPLHAGGDVNWTPSCLGCFELGAFFNAAGAFADTAYCETRSERMSQYLVLRGFATSSDYPNNPTILDSLDAVGGPDVVQRYVLPLIGSYAYYDWVEVDAAGLETWSVPFEVGARPEEWNSWVSVSSFAIDELGLGAYLEAVPPDESEPEAEPGNAGCADIVVYSSVETLAEPARARIAADNPGKRILKIVPAYVGGLPDKRAQTCRSKIAAVIHANQVWNAYCIETFGLQCTTLYPTNPGPEVYIAGDVQIVEPAVVNIAAWQGGGKRSDLALGDIAGDGMPDCPISRIPVSTVAQMESLMTATQQWNAGQFVDAGKRLAPILGDKWQAGTAPYGSGVAVTAGDKYTAFGYAPLSIQRESQYADLWCPAATRRAAFMTRVNAGVREILGMGMYTTKHDWPGSFLTCDVASYSKKQRLVAWMPGCDLHNTWHDPNYGGVCATQEGCQATRALMLNDLNKTCLVASVSHMDTGFDYAHEVIGTYLIEERESAAGSGTKSVARIAFDAVRRAIADEPWIINHAQAVSTWGGYVRIQASVPPIPVGDLDSEAGKTTAVLTWTEPGQEEGQATRYDIRYVMNGVISEANFAGADTVPGPPTPGASFTWHCKQVTGLTSCRSYSFGMKTLHDGVWSPLSNVVATWTTCSGAEVMCDEGGMMGGGGGEFGAPQSHDHLSEEQSSQELVPVLENSVRLGAVGQDGTDLLRVGAQEGGEITVRLRQVGGVQASVDRVGLAAVDHPEGTESFALGDSVYVGLVSSAASIVDSAGVTLDSLRLGLLESGVFVRGGKYLDVTLGPSSGRSALIIESSRPRAKVVGADGGVVVQRQARNGSWEELGTALPRLEFGYDVIPTSGAETVRLVFRGNYGVRNIRLLSIVEATSPRFLEPETFEHSRLGDVSGATRFSGGTRTLVAAEDSLSAVFSDDARAPGKARSYFLAVKGWYEPLEERAAEEPAQSLSRTAPSWTFALGAARPNPTTGEATIGFTLARECQMSLRVYNVAGRLVRTLEQGVLTAGPHDTVWDGRDSGGRLVGAGVYFYRLVAEGWSSKQKLVMLQR